jgi:hypothetical protein
VTIADVAIIPADVRFLSTKSMSAFVTSNAAVGAAARLSAYLFAVVGWCCRPM